MSLPEINVLLVEDISSDALLLEEALAGFINPASPKKGLLCQSNF